MLISCCKCFSFIHTESNMLKDYYRVYGIPGCFMLILGTTDKK